MGHTHGCEPRLTVFFGHGGDCCRTSWRQRSVASPARCSRRTTPPAPWRWSCSAVALIPGCDGASISVVIGRKKVDAEAASGRTASRSRCPAGADWARAVPGRGLRAQTVRVPDIASATRRPDFTPCALAAGVPGMMSLQLFVELGALSLSSRAPGPSTTSPSTSECCSQLRRAGLLGRATAGA